MLRMAAHDPSMTERERELSSADDRSGGGGWKDTRGQGWRAGRLHLRRELIDGRQTGSASGVR